jgi:hypothetical protein
VGSEKSALMLPKPSADTHTSICEPSVSQKIVSETTQGKLWPRRTGVNEVVGVIPATVVRV